MREGKWYLDAFCHKANGLRRFQVDRVRAVRPTGRPADVGTLSEAERRSAIEAGSLPRRLGGRCGAGRPARRRARFAVEGLVTSGLEELGDGRLVATIPVSDTEGWFGRLLLLLGPEAEVIGPPDLVDAGTKAARRALARYGR